MQLGRRHEKPRIRRAAAGARFDNSTHSGRLSLKAGRKGGRPSDRPPRCIDAASCHFVDGRTAGRILTGGLNVGFQRAKSRDDSPRVSAERREWGGKQSEGRVTVRIGAVAGGDATAADRRGRAVRGGVVDHLVLLKPRVMSLVVFTGAVGFVLAPGPIDWLKLRRDALGDGGRRRRMRRAQHVVGRRHRRQHGAHRDAADPARRGAAAPGAGDRRLLSIVSVARARRCRSTGSRRRCSR